MLQQGADALPLQVDQFGWRQPLGSFQMRQQLEAVLSSCILPSWEDDSFQNSGIHAHSAVALFFERRATMFLSSVVARFQCSGGAKPKLGRSSNGTILLIPFSHR